MSVNSSKTLEFSPSLSHGWIILVAKSKFHTSIKKNRVVFDDFPHTRGGTFFLPPTVFQVFVFSETLQVSHELGFHQQREGPGGHVLYWQPRQSGHPFQHVGIFHQGYVLRSSRKITLIAKLLFERLFQLFEKITIGRTHWTALFGEKILYHRCLSIHRVQSWPEARFKNPNTTR